MVQFWQVKNWQTAENPFYAIIGVINVQKWPKGQICKILVLQKFSVIQYTKFHVASAHSMHQKHISWIFSLGKKKLFADTSQSEGLPIKSYLKWKLVGKGNPKTSPEDCPPLCSSVLWMHCNHFILLAKQSSLTYCTSIKHMCSWEGQNVCSAEDTEKNVKAGNLLRKSWCCLSTYPCKNLFSFYE